MYMNYLSYINQITEICRKNNHHLINIGMINNHPLLMIVAGNVKSKNVICFSAGIHGNEISGPLAVLDFLNQYRASKNDPKIIIFPVANPVGFNDNTYFVRDGQNLNRNFGKKKIAGENHLLYTATMNEPISFLLRFTKTTSLLAHICTDILMKKIRQTYIYLCLTRYQKFAHYIKKIEYIIIKQKMAWCQTLRPTVLLKIRCTKMELNILFV